MRDGWHLVLPVKGGPSAKSRLVGAPVDRRLLASAFALDCVASAVATPGVTTVVVVCDDPRMAEDVAALGGRAVAESRPGAGLLDAIRDGVASLPPGAPAAVLLADVPAVRPEDLRRCLAAAELALEAGSRQAFVPDAEGTGTVLLAAARSDRLAPRFGPASARAHAADGAARLDLDLPRLRRDVDSWQALQHAATLGLGPRTAAVLSGAA